MDHEPPGLRTLHQALDDMGYKDGKNLNFDWRNQPDAAAATIRNWVASARGSSGSRSRNQCGCGQIG
jgi:hypothetical protein